MHALTRVSKITLPKIGQGNFGHIKVGRFECFRSFDMFPTRLRIRRRERLSYRKLWVPFNCWIWELVGTLLEIVQVVAMNDLALHHFDPRLAPISAYRRPFPPILKVASLSTVGAQYW